MQAMIPKDLEKRLKELNIWGRIKTIQTTAQLRSPNASNDPQGPRKETEGIGYLRKN